MNTKRSELNDFYLMRYVSSPDHNRVTGQIAYTVSIPHPYEYEQKVILRNPVTGEEAAVSAGGKQEEYPRFSPDGTKLAFVSNVSGEPQIWVADLVGGGVTKLTSLRYGASNPVWSPDGTMLAFLSACRPEEEAFLQTPESPEEKAARLRAESMEAVVIEDYGYKDDEAMGFRKKTVSHLWVISAAEGLAKRLTDGDRDHVMPVWSPDSQYLIFASNRCRPREESIGMDLFRVPAGGGEINRLTEDVWIAYYPKAFQPLFTPDGSTIVFGALEPSLAGGMPATRLYKLSAGGGRPESIWPEEAPCYEATCFLYNAENYGSFPQNAQISEDGKFLYFLSGWQGACNVYRAQIEGEPQILQITEEKACYRNLCPPVNGRMLAARGSFDATPQLCLLDLETGKAEPVSDTNPWIRERSLSSCDELWFHTLDGKGKVHGFIMPPQHREPNKKYPAVLYIHGGPTPFYGYALTYEYQVLAAAGIGVIFCNFRGTGGYGDEHGALSQATDGTAMTDLLQFVDECVCAYPWIDGDRIGVTGGSFGGYMTNWLVTHTRRFKAAVTQRSIANELIQYASSDMAGSSKGYNDFTDFMKAELRKSAVAYADKINIPFLILHSLGDMRCPVEHAHQLFTAVKDTHPDLPVRMVLFPDSNHGLTMGGPMHLRIAHYKETIEWFQKYL